MNYEKVMTGNLKEISKLITDTYLEKSRFWSISERYEYVLNGFDFEIVLLEKMKTTLGERIALQITFMQDGEMVIMNAIATGFEGLLFNKSPEGKQATLEKLQEIIEKLGL